MFNKLKKKMFRKITRLLLQLTYKFAEEGVRTCEYMNNIYYNLPDDLKNVVVDHYYFYLFDNVESEKQSIVERWLKD